MFGGVTAIGEDVEGIGFGVVLKFSCGSPTVAEVKGSVACTTICGGLFIKSSGLIDWAWNRKCWIKNCHELLKENFMF